MAACYVGIDVAAETVTVVWWHDGQYSPAQTVAQSQAGYRTLLDHLSRIAAPEATVVVLEATSTYWMTLALWLHQQGFQVSVVNPLQPYHFAKARLQRAKTDPVDARLLSEFARLHQPPRWTPPPAIAEQLTQLLSLREDFVQSRLQWHNRLHALTRRPDPVPAVVAACQRQLDACQQEIDALTAAIDQLLHADHAWAASVQRLLTIPGIGILTAAWLLVATQNFTLCTTPDQVTAFAGLAPHVRQSGTSRHSHAKTGRGGHLALRRCLYMAAGAALQHNPPVRQHYRRLVERGKPPMVARLAAARKLLHIAWAVVVHQRSFDPNWLASRADTPIAA
jgi:transposase